MVKFLFLFFMAMTVSTQLAFAHPYINSTSINDTNGPVTGIKIIGLNNGQNSSDVEIEIFSDQWIIKNFVWMLLGSIMIFTSVFGLIMHSEELPTLKFLKKNNNPEL